MKGEREKHEFRAEQLYACVGISRQSLHRQQSRQKFFDKQAEAILGKVNVLRQSHPKMGARSIYKRMKGDKKDCKLLDKIGRDKFEQLLLNSGYRLHCHVNRYRTTRRGKYSFPNLIEGEVIYSVNRVWMSDITYLIIYDRVSYITSIIDVYSRRLLGYSVSEDMSADSTVKPALKMALERRSKSRYLHLIFHSDGGGQYIENMFLEQLKQYCIRSSMASVVYENPFIERLHRTIKNDYLIPWGVLTFNEIRVGMKRFDYLYNHDRGHQSLYGYTPVAFEKWINRLTMKHRPGLLIKKIEQK